MTPLLGVDTGGTFTDAVVWCDETDHVLGTAKAPTTHDDLAHGIGAAIDGALNAAGVSPGSIGLVSLSTTLATNALVEGKGRRACLVLVGFDEDTLDRGGLREALGDDALIVGEGGHTSHGDEARPLAFDEILGAVEAVADDVEAFAVTSQFSVRNPAHEVALRDAIVGRTGRPVTCSHELSASLNGPKRGVTALLRSDGAALATSAASRCLHLVEASFDALQFKVATRHVGDQAEAHRLGTVQRADEIMILRDGHVIEYGERERLVSLTGVAREVVREDGQVKCYLPDDAAVLTDTAATKVSVARHR